MAEAERVEHWEQREDEAWQAFSVTQNAYELASSRFAHDGDPRAYEDMLHAAVKLGRRAEKVVAARALVVEARMELEPRMAILEDAGRQWSLL